jgi:hypothetical protein
VRPILRYYLTISLQTLQRTKLNVSLSAEIRTRDMVNTEQVMFPLHHSLLFGYTSSYSVSSRMLETKIVNIHVSFNYKCLYLYLYAGNRPMRESKLNISDDEINYGVIRMTII